MRKRDAALGALLTIAAFALYGGGVLTGWTLREKRRTESASALNEEQERMLETLRRRQEAENALLTYSVDAAYGRNGASESTESSSI